jgi:endonuclease IV
MTLTFNATTTNKQELANISSPFQIMPSTVKFITQNTLDEYTKAKINNPLILIHMNYICRVFSSDTIKPDSLSRRVLRVYKSLAESIQTKNILIHLPFSLSEYNHLQSGFEVIQTELGDDINVHLEMPAWCKTLRNLPRDDYFNEIDKFMKPNYNYVFDTAHLFANRYTTKEIINLFEKYETKYCHLNGNLNPRYHNDKHIAIFNEMNKMPDWKEICKYISETKIICIAEISKQGQKWEEWEQFSKDIGFDLVPYNKAFII